MDKPEIKIDQLLPERIHKPTNVSLFSITPILDPTVFTMMRLTLKGSRDILRL